MPHPPRRRVWHFLNSLKKLFIYDTQPLFNQKGTMGISRDNDFIIACH